MSQTGPYEWLTINADGSVTIDIAGCSLIEMDRRQIIAEELQAGRLVLAQKYADLMRCCKTLIVVAQAFVDPPGHDALDRAREAVQR